MNFKPFFESHLKRVRWKGDEGEGCCPFHDDRHPSLSVNLRTGLWWCHSCKVGGTASKFAIQLGVTSPVPVQHYHYHDEEGNLLYRISRTPDKKITAERLLSNGDWIDGLGNSRRVMYRLHELVNSEMPICVLEGEPKADLLWWQAEFHGAEFPVTCNPFGAGNWRHEYSDYLKGRQIFIIPDNDPAGFSHAKEIFKFLWGLADGVVICPLPDLNEKEDVIEWFAKGHTFTELIVLLDNAWQRSLLKGILRPTEKDENVARPE